MPDAGDIILRWDQHNQTQDIQSLWESREFLDVTLVSDDDDQLEAHKLVLSAASPFFRKILQRNPHSHPLLYLRGATKKDIQALLLFSEKSSFSAKHIFSAKFTLSALLVQIAI